MFPLTYRNCPEGKRQSLSSARFELSRVKLEQLCNENAEDIDCGLSSRDVRVSYGLNL